MGEVSDVATLLSTGGVTAFAGLVFWLLRSHLNRIDKFIERYDAHVERTIEVLADIRNALVGAPPDAAVPKTVRDTPTARIRRIRPTVED